MGQILLAPLHLAILTRRIAARRRDARLGSAVGLSASPGWAAGCCLRLTLLGGFVTGLTWLIATLFIPSSLTFVTGPCLRLAARLLPITTGCGLLPLLASTRWLRTLTSGTSLRLPARSISRCTFTWLALTWLALTLLALTLLALTLLALTLLALALLALALLAFTLLALALLAFTLLAFTLLALALLALALLALALLALALLAFTLLAFTLLAFTLLAFTLLA
ncbi:MAG: hypothetical protein ACOYMC_12895, partial [Pirellulales bacterium]